MSAPLSTLVGMDAVRAWLRDQLSVLEALPNRHLTAAEVRALDLEAEYPSREPVRPGSLRHLALIEESAALGGAEAKQGLGGPAGVLDALSAPPRAADGPCAPGAACVLLLGAMVDFSPVTWGQWALLALILAVLLGAMGLMICFALFLDRWGAEREREAEEAEFFDHRKVPTDGRWR